LTVFSIEWLILELKIGGRSFIVKKIYRLITNVLSKRCFIERNLFISILSKTNSKPNFWIRDSEKRRILEFLNKAVKNL